MESEIEEILLQTDLKLTLEQGIAWHYLDSTIYRWKHVENWWCFTGCTEATRDWFD